ncbi:hypothetical protein CMQ_5793 [Grosmannia clavigera kw1407]|uniref:Uncharacterized protein n=1 Tax=Grosmannia clavigera (strain kw1407 / UAMH 11150) TaxID=655863 RepID=F0XT96_GROCL|nr:uncharacterized protein CMQ_5793 [Grosmannia clavigera kw1407]EFW99372.1 hypothetical protein CMQ_5793 [Grosmannia clavigera kw1407]
MRRFFGRSAALPAKLTTHESEVSFASASASAYEMLLQSSSTEREVDRNKSATRRELLHRTSSPHALQRVWLAAADARRPSWTGERPAARKLVKDPNGSARPSFSVEISDRNDRPRGRDTAAEGLRRTVARWREMRWGSTAP